MSDEYAAFQTFLESRLPGDDVRIVESVSDVLGDTLHIVVSRRSEGLQRTITVELPVLKHILDRWEKWHGAVLLIEAKLEAIEMRG